MDRDIAFKARFEELLDLHGARLERWPAGDAGRARDLVAADPQARRMFAQAEQLDAELAEIAAPTPLGADRLGRILSGIAERRRAAGVSLAALFRPRQAVAMMAIACVVFGLGAWTGITVEASADQTLIAGVDLGDEVWSGFDR
jgi:hypothetical protein